MDTQTCIVIFILVLLTVAIITTCMYAFVRNPPYLGFTLGGMIKGGGDICPIVNKECTTTQNILIVDVANMYVGWSMELDRPNANPDNIMAEYIACANDHYKRFALHNDTNVSAVIYVIKNFKYASDKHKIVKAPKIQDATFDKIRRFVKPVDKSMRNAKLTLTDTPAKNVYVAVAEDYTIFPYSIWKSNKHHYLKGQDDLLCFKLAQYFKKKYMNAVIMSDDKYKDFEQFGMVPEFTATYFGATGETTEKIRTTHNALGQLKDYKMVRITTEFSFADSRFMKTSDYKIPIPGKVWT